MDSSVYQSRKARVTHPMIKHRHVALASLLCFTVALLMLPAVTARVETVFLSFHADTVQGGEGPVTYNFPAFNNSYSFDSNEDLDLALYTGLTIRDCRINFSWTLPSQASVIIHISEFTDVIEEWKNDEIIHRFVQRWRTYILLHVSETYSSLVISVPIGAGDVEAGDSWAIYHSNEDSWFLLDTQTEDGYLSTIIEEEHNYLLLSIFREEVVEILDPVDPDPVDPDPVDPLLSGLTTGDVLVTSAILITCIAMASLAIAVGRKSYQERVKRQFNTSGTSTKHTLTIDEVFENENRARIIDLVLENPGIHFNELLRETGLAPGNLVWHLEILQNYTVIGKKSIGQYVVYFPFLTTNPLSNIDVTLAKSKTTMEILKRIENEPGIHANIIAKSLGLDHKTVKYHVDKLIEKELVKSKKSGRTNQLFPVLDVENGDLD